MSNEQQGKPVSVERRRHSRRLVHLPVTVHVLVEEETFSPFTFQGVCENISVSGALMAVRDLSKATYVKLIQRPRYIRLACRLPGHDQPVQLFGKLIWFDFQEQPGQSICKLATAFEPIKEEVRETLERYIESLPVAPAKYDSPPNEGRT